MSDSKGQLSAKTAPPSAAHEGFPSGQLSGGPNQQRLPQQIAESLLTQVQAATETGAFELAVAFVEQLLADYSEQAHIVAHAVCATAEALLMSGSAENIRLAFDLCTRLKCPSPILPIQHQVWSLLLRACASAAISGEETRYESLAQLQTTLTTSPNNNPGLVNAKEVYAAATMALKTMESLHVNKLGQNASSIITKFIEEHHHQQTHGTLYLSMLIQGAVFAARLGVADQALSHLEAASLLLEEICLNDTDLEVKARLRMSCVYKELGYFSQAQRELSDALGLADPNPEPLERLQLLLYQVDLYRQTEQYDNADRGIRAIRSACLGLLPRELRRSIVDQEHCSSMNSEDAQPHNHRQTIALLAEAMLRELEQKIETSPLDSAMPTLCGQLETVGRILAPFGDAQSISQRILVTRAFASVHNDTSVSQQELDTLEDLSLNPGLGDLGRAQVKLLVTILHCKRGDMHTAGRMYDEQTEELTRLKNGQASNMLLSILTLEAHVLSQQENWAALLRTMELKLEVRSALGLSNSPGAQRDRDLLASLRADLRD